MDLPKTEASMTNPDPYYGKSVVITGYDSQSRVIQIFLQDIRANRTALWGNRNDILDMDPSSANLCTYPPVISEVGEYFMGRGWCINNSVPITGETKHPIALPKAYPTHKVDARVQAVVPVVLLLEDTSNTGVPAGGLPPWIGPFELDPLDKDVTDPNKQIVPTVGTKFTGALLNDMWFMKRGLRTQARGRQYIYSGLVVSLNVTLAFTGGAYAGQSVMVNPFNLRLIAPSRKYDPTSPTMIDLETVGAQGEIAIDDTFINS